METRDRNGNIVAIGSKVRILSIDPGLVASLPADERERVRSMIGCSLFVDEIDEHGFAIVTQDWVVDNGKTESHSISLAPTEMELST